jgi:hypothetical protein
MYFVFMHEKRKTKLVEIVLEGRTRQIMKGEPN